MAHFGLRWQSAAATALSHDLSGELNRSESGVALRLPPQSRTRFVPVRFSSSLAVNSLYRNSPVRFDKPVRQAADIKVSQASGLARIVTHTVPPWPLEISGEESNAGFRRMTLSLGNFIGAYPGDNIEVAGRPLSESDVLIKVRGTTRQGETKVYYRHLRFGYPNTMEKVRIFWTDIRFGFWRSWLRGHWPWRVDWQHVPQGYYDSPADDCSRTLAWPGIVGLVFHEYAV